MTVLPIFLFFCFRNAELVFKEASIYLSGNILSGKYIMEQQEWPADINDLIEFLPQLEAARHQVRLQLNALRQQYHWNRRLSDAENDASIPGMKPLRDLCVRYDQQIDSFPEELSTRMHALSMTELLERRKAYSSLEGKERLECAYQGAAAQRMRGLFSNLLNIWEPEVRRCEISHLDHIDFQAIIQNLREWYAFMRDPENKRFSAHEPVGSIPEYIERFEAVRDAVAAGYDMAFMQAMHPRLGATADVRGLSEELLRDIITRYGGGRGPAPRARWFQWKICRGPLDEQKIPRGGARAVQPGMPFPNLYRCNKVLVNQKKLVKHCLQRQVAFAAVALRAAALRKFIADYRLHL